MDSVQNRTEWECGKYVQSFLLSWTSCCYKLRARVRGFSLPLQDVTLRIASSHLPQGSPTHMGPTSLTASHTSSYDNGMRTAVRLDSVMLSRALSDLSRSAERKRGSQPWPLTFHPPPRAGFSTEDLARVMVCGGYLPRVRPARETPTVT